MNGESQPDPQGPLAATSLSPCRVLATQGYWDHQQISKSPTSFQTPWLLLQSIVSARIGNYPKRQRLNSRKSVRKAPSLKKKKKCALQRISGLQLWFCLNLIFEYRNLTRGVVTSRNQSKLHSLAYNLLDKSFSLGSDSQECLTFIMIPKASRLIVPLLLPSSPALPLIWVLEIKTYKFIFR